MSQLVWLITGCSSGFGEIFVQKALAKGDKVIATARRLDTIQHLKELGASILQLDLTSSEKTIRETIAQAIDIYGRIDVLVNNAAYIATGTWEDIAYDDFIAQFETNVFGTLKVTRAVLPHLRQRRTGTLVFISSLSGWIGDAFCCPYSGSKFALEGMVEALAKETASANLGIKTLLVEPGRFRTHLLSPSNRKPTQSTIPEYQEAAKIFDGHITKEDRNQAGDTKKAVDIIIGLVRDGAGDKPLPLRLPLGNDCYEAVKKKCEDTLQLLEEWKPVITSTDFST